MDSLARQLQICLLFVGIAIGLLLLFTASVAKRRSKDSLIKRESWASRFVRKT